MSASSSRPLVGLAAAALVLGLVGAPLTASAEPTPAPTASASATATPTPNPGAESSSTESPSASPSETSSSPDPAATPSGTASPSASPSETDGSSPSPDPSTRSRTGGDLRGVPGPTGSAEPEPRLGAQAVAGPSITLAKSASPTRVSRVGQVVTYRFTAANNGSVDLSGVRITDELEGLSDLTCNQPVPATLAVGAAPLSCSATLTVTQAILDFGDVYNFSTVFGTVVIPETPDDYVGANAAARVVVDQQPSIALTASVSPTGRADQGDRLRYDATATNTGNVTLTRARITSSLNALDLDCEPSARATLAPGASISCAGSYRVSAADARRGRVSNLLTARAERPFGDTSSSGDDVTDDVRLRVAVTKVADDSDPGLADTGGPALPVGLAGLVAVATGLALIRRTRRL